MYQSLSPSRGRHLYYPHPQLKKKKKKIKTKSRNIEGTELVIDHTIYTQKVRLKSLPLSHHIHAQVLLLPGVWISIRRQLVGKEAFSKIIEIIKILDLFLCPQETAFVAQCVYYAYSFT